MKAILRCAVVLGAGGLLAACAENTLTLRAARAQQNSAMALAFLDTVYNRHEVDQAFRRYVGPGLREHSVGPVGSAESARVALLRQVSVANVGLRIEVGHSIAQGELVAVQSALVRSADGHESAPMPRFDLFRFSRGRIVEHWSLSESLAGLP